MPLPVHGDRRRGLAKPWGVPPPTGLECDTRCDTANPGNGVSVEEARRQSHARPVDTKGAEQAKPQGRRWSPQAGTRSAAWEAAAAGCWFLLQAVKIL